MSVCFGLENGKSRKSGCLGLEHVKSGGLFNVDSKNDLSFSIVLSSWLEESSKSLIFSMFEISGREVSFVSLSCWIVEWKLNLILVLNIEVVHAMLNSQVVLLT